METSVSGINQEAVRQAIAIMQRAVDREAPFNMQSWQAVPVGAPDTDVCKTEFEAHQCGMVACFGGWVALSPEWQAIGGTIDGTGGPLLQRGDDVLFGAEAIAEWLGIETWRAELITCTGFSFLSTCDMFKGKALYQITAQDLIDVLQTLLK
ncbi:hypothetical protein [Nevskia ramosa]|uniref:hypothetical protein n=1 Tax=Nevskia ramosa TaxID=64002 RepID=UPI002355F94E|nr:hypothetical protein [Nevskia ramosa]